MRLLAFLLSRYISAYDLMGRYGSERVVKRLRNEFVRALAVVTSCLVVFGGLTALARPVSAQSSSSPVYVVGAEGTDGALWIRSESTGLSLASLMGPLVRQWHGASSGPSASTPR